MEIISKIVEILISLGLASGGVYFLVTMAHTLSKGIKTETENTFIVRIHNDEMPSAIGGIFGDTFANLISNFLERKNNK